MLTSTCLTLIEAFWDCGLLHYDIATRFGRDPMLSTEDGIIGFRRNATGTVHRAESQQLAIANIQKEMHIVDAWSQ